MDMATNYQDRMKRWLPAILFTALLAVVLLILFYEPLFSGRYLWGPDNSAFEKIRFRSMLPAGFSGFWLPASMLGRGSYFQSFVPHGWLLLLLPGEVFHVWSYIIDVIALVLAGLYLLRALGLGWRSACVGALALGLSAHSFTIISAGHLGKFGMMPFAVLMLAFITRAVPGGSLFHYAGAGVTAAIGFFSQGDVMIMFFIMGAVYGCVLLVRNWPAAGGSAAPDTERPPSPARLCYIGRTVLGVLLAAIFFMAIASEQVLEFYQFIPKRAQQAQPDMGAQPDDPQKKWEFSTNWSLPPEELLEFVAPCIYGNESNDLRAPYWGRLGQTLNWEKIRNTRQCLMNLRQHTVYLGVIQLLLAFYLLARLIQPSGTVSKAVRWWGWGWWAAFVVFVLLALGRYFPLYRAFYALPLMSNIRAPVKFLHLAEVALAVVCAMGLDTLLRDLLPAVVPAAGAEPLRKAGKQSRLKSADNGVPVIAAPVRKLLMWFAILPALLGVGFLLGKEAVDASIGTLIRRWTAMDLGNYTKAMLDAMHWSLGHAAVFCFAGAAIFGLAFFSAARRWVHYPLIASILVLLAVQQGTVNKRYVRVWDEDRQYASNVLVDQLRQQKPLARANLILIEQLRQLIEQKMQARTPQQGLDELIAFWRWCSRAFTHHGVQVLDTATEEWPEDYRAFSTALRAAPRRFWELTNTRDIIGLTASMGPLIDSGEFEVVGYFELTRAMGMVPGSRDRGQVVWLRNKRFLPRAALYQAWDVVTSQEALARLASPAWDPTTTLLVEGNAMAARPDPPPPMQEAQLDGYTANRINLRVTAPAPGIVLLNDKYDPGWRVMVDGAPAELLKCNWIMRGVKVGAGPHRIEFVYRPYRATFIACLCALSVFAAWGFARLPVRRRAMTPQVAPV